jgi:glycosyltransferase involved in cell wall biosynthesis
LVALAARLRHRKFIYASAHVVDFDPEANPFIASRKRHALYRLGIGLADAIVVQTDEQVALCRERFSKEPLLIRSISEPTAPAQRPGDTFVWIGRADPSKRPLDFVSLARELPDARFHMVMAREGLGASGVCRDVDAAAADVPNLKLSGGLTRAEVGKVIDRAVALVSTSESEGMPNVFLEAWTRGVPVLALHHDPDGVIERERIGASAHGSMQRLVDDAREMWRTRADQRAISQRCRDYVEQNHSPAVIGAQWLNVLRPDQRRNGTPATR